MENRKQGKLERFEDLVVWQKAHQLVLEVYKDTRDYPAEERFSLVLQMRRAVVSIPANIAEGFKKHGQRDKMNFYNIAQGSLEELRYYMILSKDLNYIQSDQNIIRIIEEVGKMLYSLRASIEGT
jgi:four helix bundle protein